MTSKRAGMLKAEKDRQIKRESETVERKQREDVAFSEETAATKERSEHREDWRQEQHAARREEEKKRKEQEALRLLQEEERKKQEAKEAERKENMAKLHRQAVEHKIRDKRAAVQHDEEMHIKNAEVSAAKTTHTLDEDMKRNTEHIENERKRKINLLHADAERQRNHIEETTKHQILSADPDQKSHFERVRQNAIIRLEEETSKKLFDIEQESKHLKDETIKNAANKKTLVLRDEDRKKREAVQRTENFEKWVQKG